MPHSVSSQQVVLTSWSFVGWLACRGGFVIPIVDLVVGERWDNEGRDGTVRC
jgi:hypothetical protein